LFYSVLEAFMPRSGESYKKYRDAALIGAKASSESQCSQEYKSCKYSTEDIIKFNEKIEADSDEMEEEATTDAPKKKAKTTRKPKNSKTSANSTTTTGSTTEAPSPAKTNATTEQ